MKLDIKKLLLAGTAIVAVGASPIFISPAHANSETLVGSVTWAVDADQNGAPADGTGAAAGDAVDVDTFTLTITDDGTANDGGGLGSYTVGAITDTNTGAAGTGGLTVTSNVGGGDVTATISSVNIAGNALISNTDAHDATIAATVTGAMTVGGTLALTNTDTSAADTIGLAVGGDLSVTGATTVIASNGTGSDGSSVLTVGGNAAFTGGLTLTNSGGGAEAELELNGTSAQTVTGAIAGDGNVNVDNASGVTFADTVTAGNIEIEKALGNSSATFQSAVNANISLGDDGNAGDVNTVTFDGGFTVTGTVDGTAGETNNVVVTGGNTINAASNWGAVQDLTTVTLTGSGTELANAGALQATTINVGAGTTLTSSGDIVSTDTNFTGAGTIALQNGITLNGNLDNTSGSGGVGTLTGTGAGTNTVTGNVGATNALSSISTDGTGTFNFLGTVAATTISETAGGTLDFADDVTGNINLGDDGLVVLANNADVTGAIDNTSGVVAQGNITFNGASTITGAVGASNTLNLITIGVGGAADFDSTVNVDSIDNSNNGTINFGGDVTVTNGAGIATGTGSITFDDNADLTGDIVGGTGAVNFDGASNVTGAINAADVDFDGGAGDTVTLSGLVTATDIGIDGVGTVQANGGLDGAVNFGADGTLRLADSGDINGDVTATALDGNGSLFLEGAASIDGFGAAGDRLKAFTASGAAGSTVSLGGDFFAADTTNVGGSQLEFTGATGFVTNVAAGQNISFDITGASTAGSIDANDDGNATVDATANLHINVATGDEIADTSTFTFINGNGGTGVAGLTTTITDNSFLIDFTQVGAGVEDLVVQAAVATKASAATNINNEKVGGVLDALGTTANTELDQILQNINSASSQDQVNELLESTTPNVDAGVMVSTVNVTNQSINVMGTRLAEIRDDKAGSGMFAGNGMFGTKVWGQVFGNMIDQDKRDDVEGYEADTYGLAFGIDTGDRLEGVTIGIAGSYADTDVESDGANKTDTEIDSWQIALYGDYDLTDTAFLNVMVGYAYNDIESERKNVGGTGLTASGDSDGNQYFARFELGNDYYTNVLNDAIITPTAMINYIRVDADGYTESGAGGANLVVDQEDADILELGLGVEASWKRKMSNGGLFEPAVHVGYRYDVIGDEAEATSRFTGGGASFNTEGFDPAESTFNAGFGATVYNTNNWEFTGGYDFEYKSDYTAHSGLLKALYKF